ncbi:MAG: beta-lactamase family protein [Clostridia bacterium]|nr:beta-lactamase family protein [Clostridia bacterium]
MKNYLNTCIQTLLANETARNIIVRVGQGDTILCDVKATSEDRVLTDHTLFDMASVTKIVVTTSLALLAFDRGLLSPSDPVSKFFPVPEDKKQLTIQHLMTHTMGIGHKSLLGSDGSYEGIEQYILNIPSDFSIGSDVRYSCPAFILLGRILEQIFGDRLDRAFDTHVAKPLGMKETCFLPDRTLDIVNANPTDGEEGLVHDPNCRYLGGVCGNAGLFSNLSDMTVYAKTLAAGGAPLFSKEIFALATQNHTEGMAESRGLGYLYVDDRYTQAGGLFSAGSIGHCGHTGQSVFVDRKSGLYVIILSDATRHAILKYEKKKYYKVVKQMRSDLHGAIKLDLGL